MPNRSTRSANSWINRSRCVSETNTSWRAAPRFITWYQAPSNSIRNGRAMALSYHINDTKPDLTPFLCALVSWLSERRIHYWGDIDTLGFAILNRLRNHLPQAESLLMDRATLDAPRQLWTREPKDRRFTGQLDRLSHSEQQLFE